MIIHICVNEYQVTLLYLENCCVERVKLKYYTAKEIVNIL